MQTQMRMPIAVDYSMINIESLSEQERFQILELAERVARYGAKVRDTLSSPEASRRFVSAYLQGCEREVFLCVFLTSQHEVIAAEEMFQGTIDSCSIHPREIVKRALELNAAAMIVAHPHPSGCETPSAADRQITTRLKEALDLLNVRLLDHLVVGSGSGRTASFAERGWL